MEASKERGTGSAPMPPEKEPPSTQCSGSLPAIQHALALLVEPGGVAELRVPITRSGTVSGYFDNRMALAKFAMRLDGKGDGVCVTLNPVQPDLLARAHNRVNEYAKVTTSDTDIVRRRWLLIDCDVKRPAGMSATDEEHQAALIRGYQVSEWLIAHGVPKASMLLVDSGNGCHILVRIDLPNDDNDTSLRLVERVLASIGHHHDDERVHIDRKTANAARICKIPGTTATKGDNFLGKPGIPARPHRVSRIMEQPETVRVTPTDVLEQIASLVPEAPKRTMGTGNGRPHLDIAAWLARHGMDVARVKSNGDGGMTYILRACPWKPDEHTNESAYIIQFANGAIAAGCLHDSCHGNDWRASRLLMEGEAGTVEEHTEDEAHTAAFFEEGHFVPALLGAHLMAAGTIRLGYDGRLWRYDHGVYSPDGEGWARQRVRALVGKRFRRNHVEEVNAWLRCALPSLGHEPQPQFINCTNGLLDWKTGMLHPHSPDVVSTNQIPVAWNPEATAPTIARFLRQVVPEDATALVEEIAGYALYAGNPFRKAVMLFGPGGNGKSTLLRLITALLGGANVASVPLQALGENRFAAARIFGKLANICGDLDARAIERTDLFKQITGNEPIDAEHKFKEGFSFTSYALPLFSANEYPRTSDQTDAWFDRWIIIEMPHRFEGTIENDPGLSDKLVLELEGFLVRAVAGLQRLMARKRFALPASVAEMGEHYRNTLDTVRAFVGEECHFDLDAWEDRAEVYRRYREWCREGGRYALSSSTFNNHLQQTYGPRIMLRTHRGRPGWLGLSLGGMADAVSCLISGGEGDEGDGFPTLKENKILLGSKTVTFVTPITPGETNGTANGTANGSFPTDIDDEQEDEGPPDEDTPMPDHLEGIVYRPIEPAILRSPELQRLLQAARQKRDAPK